MTTPKLLPCYPREASTSVYPDIPLKLDIPSNGNPCDEINHLPQVNSVLPYTTYRVNYFIRSKKKRLLRLDKLNRGVKNSTVKMLMKDIRKHGFLKNLELIPALEAVKQMPKACFIDAKTDQVVPISEVTENDYLIVDGQHRLEAYFRLDAEAGMKNEQMAYDLLVSIIKIPHNLSITEYIYAINTQLDKWDAQARTDHMVAAIADHNTALYHALNLIKDYGIGIRYATALFQFHDGFKTSMQTQFMEGGELHPFLKSTPEKIERGHRLFDSLRLGFYSQPKLLKNMAALNFAIQIYNDAGDDNKSQMVDKLNLFFQSLTEQDAEEIAVSDKEHRQETIGQLWDKFVESYSNDPDFLNDIHQRVKDNKYAVSEKGRKERERKVRSAMLASKNARKTKKKTSNAKSDRERREEKPKVKNYQGKALYQSVGKAAEYSQWAVNFYNGCENDCEYCYCKKGVMGRNWTDKPQLKKSFDDEEDALKTFKKELRENHGKVSEHGILFSFTTDPMLPKTWGMTFEAMEFAVNHNVPVQILTKRTDWMEEFDIRNLEGLYNEHKNKIAFGFTLTGRDDLEPNASPNSDRIEAMRKLHAQGFKTFASIEPVVEPLKSIEMIEATKDCCDVFKVGLMSGKKDYDLEELKILFSYLKGLTNSRIYLKDSFSKYLLIDRDKLPQHFVNADFNIFKNQ